MAKKTEVKAKKPSFKVSAEVSVTMKHGCEYYLRASGIFTDTYYNSPDLTWDEWEQFKAEIDAARAKYFGKA